MWPAATGAVRSAPRRSASHPRPGSSRSAGSGRTVVKANCRVRQSSIRFADARPACRVCTRSISRSSVPRSSRPRVTPQPLREADAVPRQVQVVLRHPPCVELAGADDDLDDVLELGDAPLPELVRHRDRDRLAVVGEGLLAGVELLAADVARGSGRCRRSGAGRAAPT